jgi:hypothetical protein
MTSLSTRFLGQPRLTNPILGRAAAVFSSSGEPVISDFPLQGLSSIYLIIAVTQHAPPSQEGLRPAYRIGIVTEIHALVEFEMPFSC